MKNNKIGLDFHGVISAMPREFAVFCKSIRRKGIKVYVISGGPKKDIEQYLQKYGIEYDYVWAILDVCTMEGNVSFYEDGSFQVPTDIWNKAKAEYCACENIDFHVDDSNIYGKYFVTPYCKYDICNGSCSLSDGLRVDFNHPEEAAEIVADFLNLTSKEDRD